jgi:ribosomal protein L32
MKIGTSSLMDSHLVNFTNENSNKIKSSSTLLNPEQSMCIACDEEKTTHTVCMDCIVKTNHEISDEEIDKAAHENISWGGGSEGWIKSAFRQGAKWYREQLRQKQ